MFYIKLVSHWLFKKISKK